MKVQKEKKNTEKRKSNIYVLDATETGGGEEEETEKIIWGKKNCCKTSKYNEL